MIDWAAAKAEFILHPETTYAQLAAKYQCHHVSVRRVAAAERWMELRRNQATQLLQVVTQKAVYSQSEQLAACNARHLALAQKLEAAVSQRLERAPELSENALRNLAVVSEAAQRISRLALGAATENIHSDPYAQMTDAELATELERLGIEPTLH